MLSICCHYDSYIKYEENRDCKISKCQDSLVWLRGLELRKYCLRKAAFTYMHVNAYVLAYMNAHTRTRHASIYTCAYVCHDKLDILDTCCVCVCVSVSVSVSVSVCLCAYVRVSRSSLCCAAQPSRNKMSHRDHVLKRLHRYYGFKKVELSLWF